MENNAAKKGDGTYEGIFSFVPADLTEYDGVFPIEQRRM